MLSFTITEAPVDGQLPITASPSTRSGGSSRLRLFSTFQSAARPSVSSEDSHNRLKLSDILANGVPMAADPDEYTADQTFIRRLAHFEFNVYKPLHNVRILFCKNLDDLVFGEQVLGETVRNSIRMRPNMRVMPIGDRDPRDELGNPQQVEQEIYLPEDTLTGSARRLFVFIVYGNEDRLLLKAKAVIMTSSDAERVEYIKEHMMERDERIQCLAKKIAADQTVMSQYDAEEFATFMQRNERLAIPPTRYLLGQKNVLLAYRTFEPANKDSIVANLIIASTEPVFLLSLATTLSTLHPIRVILMHLRGFGYSGGKRGHTPSLRTLFQDLGQIVRHVKGFSRKPIILGGNAFAGGMIVNYERFRGHEPVDGYVLISPFMGLKWKFAWRDELATMRKDKVLNTRMGWFLLTKLTGGRLGGSRYVVDFKLNEHAYEFSPALYNRMTANYVRAFQVDSDAFKREFSAPLAFLVAGKDEFLHMDRVRERIQPMLQGESRFILQEGKTGLGLLLSADRELVEWIMGLQAVRPWLLRAKGPVEPIINRLDLALLKAFLPPAVYEGTERGLEQHVYDRLPRETDCRTCTYDLWEPSYLPGRPLGVLLMVAPRCQAFWLPALAEHYRMTIYRLNPWQRDGARVLATPKVVWQVLQHVLHIIKANHPDAPLFIGGIGYGASLILGYSQHPQREAVNGYVLVSPPMAIKSSHNRRWLQDSSIKTDTSLIMFNEPLPRVGEPPKSQYELLGRVGYIPHLIRDPENLYLSKDIVAEIKSLDAPTAVFLPANHPYMNISLLFEELGGILRPPFKLASCLPGDLGRLIEEVSAPLGDWLSQLSSSVAPRAPLVLSGPVSILDFEPIEMIGKGTFGKVWLVRHSTSKRFLALKVLDKEVIIQHKQVKQVMREKEVLSECSTCPFIVNFIGSFQDTQRLFLAMEFVIGGELFTRINTVGRLSVEDARFYVCEALMALTFMHERDIVYRDLKPENIVLDAMGHIRLVDFGFARHLESGRCGSFCGSPYYIAPEMLSTSTYGKSVDIWALGVLTYELLVGAPPFSGKTANEVYKRILFSSLEIPPSLDPDSRDLISCLLDPSPENRLGCRGPTGITEVAKHRWFKGVDWDRVRRKQVPPPYQPQFTFEGDTTNFMKFAGAVLAADPGGSDKYEGLFRNY